MKFCWSTIAVKDMDTSLDFYQNIVGLPLQNRFMGGPGIEICFLGEGETKIELICSENHQALGNIEGISLGFVVDSLEKMMDFVREKGIPIHGGPFQPNPHIRYFYVKDPNGVTIQFVENM
mgnify:CR=1 FL=1